MELRDADLQPNVDDDARRELHTLKDAEGNPKPTSPPRLIEGEFGERQPRPTVP